MLLSLVQEMSIELDNKSELIQIFSDDLKNFFGNKTYGNGIDTYLISIICVSPKFENLSIVRKPKYLTKGKVYFSVDGKEVNYGKQLQYDVKLDFETFKKADKVDASKILAKEILYSLKVFDEIKTKIKDFDSLRFKEDLSNYFKERELI